MKVLDLVFYLMFAVNREKFVGYQFLWLIGCAFSLGVASLFAFFGVDLFTLLSEKYPVAWVSAVNSPFDKKAGFGVLFGIPFGVLFCWIFYNRSRVDRIIRLWDNQNLRMPALVSVAYSLSIFVALFAVALSLQSSAPQYVLISQLAVLAAIRVFAIDRLISHFSDGGTHEQV